MNAQPRSLAGLSWVFDGSKLVQLAVLTGGVPLPPLGVVGFGVPKGLPTQVGALPRKLASGPRYQLNLGGHGLNIFRSYQPTTFSIIN